MNLHSIVNAIDGAEICAHADRSPVSGQTEYSSTTRQGLAVESATHPADTLRARPQTPLEPDSN